MSDDAADSPADNGAAGKPEPEPTQQPTAGPTDTDAAQLDDDAHQFQQHAQTINNVFASRSDGGPRRVTGTIRPAEVQLALRAFVQPAGFDNASACLASKHLVILSGQDGVGKRTGALALLRERLGATEPVISLPPSHTLTSLVEYPHFRAGRGYLVQDWSPVGTSATATAFDVDVLQRVLRQRRSFLVITTGTAVGERRSVSGVVHRWTAPDPLTILDRRLDAVGLAPAEDALARLRERLKEVHGPSDVVTVVNRLDQGVTAALDALGDADAERVRAWFVANSDEGELLAVAALCFLNHAPETIFQRLLARLVEVAGQDQRPADGTAAGGIRFPRHNQTDADTALHEIARVADGDGSGLGNLRRRFTSDRYAGLVLRELTTRYGFQLWEPLRIWMCEVAELPPGLVHVRLAMGLALYAREAPADVAQTYLAQWADGTISERLTAAYLLSWMCLDDAMASWALRTAVSWTSNAGTRRAATAAMAFGAELGVRYPSDALSWLWYLALRNEAVSKTARLSLGALLSTALDDATGTTTILRYLDRALRQLITDGVNRPEHGTYTSHVRKATLTVLTALMATQGDSTDSTTAVILRTWPENAEVLGRLWAEVLRSWPHRTDAIDGLQAVFDAMRADDSSLDVVRQFGGAVRDQLTELECELLHRDLSHALHNADTVVSPLVRTALLTALERRVAARS
ncbi:MAG TPA: hypothetical protein VFX16_10460 [Pseudonocardiaceae bacterium]|nr:hypothetical protein [Pseudonocardiaceae bacterium]